MADTSAEPDEAQTRRTYLACMAWQFDDDDTLGPRVWPVYIAARERPTAEQIVLAVACEHAKENPQTAADRLAVVARFAEEMNLELASYVGAFAYTADDERVIHNADDLKPPDSVKVDTDTGGLKVGDDTYGVCPAAPGDDDGE